MSSKVCTFAVFGVLLVTLTLVSSRPHQPSQMSHVRQKRQSDQRLAELETLLALQKYGHRHRGHVNGHKQLDNSNSYGLVDFNMIGRRKKSTRFSPGPVPQDIMEIGHERRRSSIGDVYEPEEDDILHDANNLHFMSVNDDDHKHQPGNLIEHVPQQRVLYHPHLSNVREPEDQDNGHLMK